MDEAVGGAGGWARQWNRDNQYDTNEIEKNDNNSQQNKRRGGAGEGGAVADKGIVSRCRSNIIHWEWQAA